MSPDPVGIAALIFGYVGQYAKAHPKFPVWAAQAIMLGVGMGCYILAHPPVSDYAYWRDGILFAFGLPGIASTAASIKLAPQTIN